MPGAGSDYVLCAEPRGGILAVVEAKDESHAEEAGLQQALAYAVNLGAPFAYSSNGHGIVQQDLRTGRVRQLQAFPTPGELRQRFEAGATWRGATVTGRSGGEVPNPLLQSAFTLPGHRPCVSTGHPGRAAPVRLSDLTMCGPDPRGNTCCRVSSEPG